MSKLDYIENYTLKDSSIKIAPGWGANMFSWTIDGKELMSCPDDYPAAAFKITGGGNPILFPAIGRTWDRSGDEPVSGVYHIYGEDKTYFMPSHGIVFLSDFKKIDESKGKDSVSVTYELSIPDKVREENYPFDMNFKQRFTLKPESVELEAIITNNDNRPAPAAFGYHPYFKISNKEREGVEIRIPARKHLFCTKDTVLFTGESEDTDGILRLKPDVYYDEAYGDVIGRRMSVIDEKAGHAVHVDFDDNFELMVFYTPDGSDFVCIEPWTRGLGAYEDLRNPGWESGESIPVYQPGETKTYKAAFVYDRMA